MLVLQGTQPLYGLRSLRGDRRTVCAASRYRVSLRYASVDATLALKTNVSPFPNPRPSQEPQQESQHTHVQTTSPRFSDGDMRMRPRGVGLEALRDSVDAGA